MSSQESPPSLSGYWRANLILVAVLLAIWFLSSFVLGILAVNGLNKIKMGGFPLGFWFAQQGSIFIFIGLVVSYALIMEKIDRKFDVHEHESPSKPAEAAESTEAAASAEAKEASESAESAESQEEAGEGR